jgi:divalent metal cation (Fe/Co/Zn/Cd) transporter
MHTTVNERALQVRTGLRLEAVTLGYNVIEAVVALASGAVAGSVALIGFGIDSLIESWSGLTMVWRLRSDADTARREQVERRAQRLIALSFLALAAYVGWESAEMLWRAEPPETSWTGIALAIASVIIMPILARAKRRVGQAIQSPAMVADSRQTALCSYLSAILLAGLGLHALFGWWWADPAAALAMTPIIVKEGYDAWHGKGCGCASGCSTGR